MTKKSGKVRRAVDIAGLTGGLGASYASYLLQGLFLSEDEKGVKRKEVQIDAARRVTQTMSALQGPLMKLGQTLSMQGDVLPEDVIAELSSMQMRAPGMHPSLVRAQIKSSFGVYPDELFREFSPTPFAAASLGQVHHAATRSGERVVVKVQYPDMPRTVRNDFALLKAVSLPANISRLVPRAHLEELEREISAETDYEREAANITLYRRKLKPLKFVRVPKVYAKLSSDRVLTMSPVEGMHLEEFLATEPSQSLRDTVGSNLMDLYYYQLLRMGALHADPHWGNYRFDAAGNIGLLDFGCVKMVPRDFMASLRRIFLYPGPRDSSEFRALLDERYALYGKKVSAKAHKALLSFAQNFFGKVYPPEREKDSESFDFSDGEFLKDYMRESANLMMAKGSLPEYVFLARAEAGLYQMLHKLGARVRTSKIVRQYV